MNDRVTEDLEVLKVVLRLTGSIQTGRGECDRYLRTFDYRSWPWYRDIEEEHAHCAASEPALDEFELKLWDLACLDLGFEELEPRWRISALILRIDALTRGLRDLARRWEHSAPGSCAWSRPRAWGGSATRPAVHQQGAREAWTTTDCQGGACPPGAAHLHSSWCYLRRSTW